MNPAENIDTLSAVRYEMEQEEQIETKVNPSEVDINVKAAEKAKRCKSNFTHSSNYFVSLNLGFRAANTTE